MTNFFGGFPFSFNFLFSQLSIFSRVLRDSTPFFVGPSVGPSVRPSHFTFLGVRGLWPRCSCPSDQVASNIAPAHPHATGVAVYPALLSSQLVILVRDKRQVKIAASVYPWFD